MTGHRKLHQGEHGSGGEDEIPEGSLLPQEPTAHSSTHGEGGSDELLHSDLKINPSDHHPKTTTLNEIDDCEASYILIDTASNLPSAGVENRIFFERNTGRVLWDSGLNWYEMGLSESEITHNSIQGLTSGDPHTQYLLSNGNRNVAGTLLPDTDNSFSLGSESYRFKEIHAVDVYGTVHYADIAFQEKRCAVCGEEFGVGDPVELVVTDVKKDGTYMLPKHSEC